MLENDTSLAKRAAGKSSSCSTSDVHVDDVDVRVSIVKSILGDPIKRRVPKLFLSLFSHLPLYIYHLWWARMGSYSHCHDRTAHKVSILPKHQMLQQGKVWGCASAHVGNAVEEVEDVEEKKHCAFDARTGVFLHHYPSAGISGIPVLCFVFAHLFDLRLSLSLFSLPLSLRT